MKNVTRAKSTDQIRSEYDAVQYPGGAYPQSHPDNLRTIAALAGVASPPVTSCRVLELGCAVGRNILPMAQTLPGSQFLGIDLSPRQIETGQAVVRQIGLTNVELRCQDLMELSIGEGHFDYIIAHGLYSWTPQSVRNRLLEICARQLSPQGLAYISYNALPGWHLLQIVRDMMFFHTAGAEDPVQRGRLAREMLEFAAQPSPGFHVYKDLLNGVRKETSGQPDWYLLHDFAEAVNEPVYFRDFVGHSTASGLRYLGNAESGKGNADLLSPAVREQLNRLTADERLREQYLDFLQGRAFRASILCRPDVQQTATTGARALSEMFVAARLREETGTDAASGAAVVRFGTSGADSTLTLSDPAMITAMGRINGTWPRAVPFTELVDLACMISGEPRDQTTAGLADMLLLAYRSGIVELWSRPTDFLANGTEHPRVTPLARLQLMTGESVVNLRHRQMPITDGIKALLPLLDGARSRGDLLRELGKAIDNGAIQPTNRRDITLAVDRSALLSQFLDDLTARSLLIA